MKREFSRNCILATIDIGGFYKYKNKFQIYSLDNSHPKPPTSGLGHFPLILEYAFEINENQKSRLQKEMCLKANEEIKEKLLISSFYKSKREEISVLLSLLTPSVFFEYNRNTQEMSWFVPLNSDCHELFWGQKLYIPGDLQIEESKDFTESGLQKIPLTKTSDYYKRLFTYPGQNVAEEKFTLPDIIDKLVDNYFSLKEDAQLAFLQAATFFYQSMNVWFNSKSLAYTALISCFESLIHHEYKNEKYKQCKTCESTQYAVMEKFRRFLRVDDLPNDDETKIYVKMIYDLRSKILHRGYLMKEDFSIPGCYTFEESNQRSLLMNVVSITRRRLIQWLIDN